MPVLLDALRISRALESISGKRELVSIRDLKHRTLPRILDSLLITSEFKQSPVNLSVYGFTFVW